ncbi:MAG: PAS domain-containing protein [Thermoanaerobaculia bacterium]
MSSRSEGEATNLRLRVEESLKSRAAGADPLPSPEETNRLLHELQVHKIELEMQNEELREARSALEKAVAGLTELYDFAPAGYFSLDREGMIVQSNLAAATLLGTPRAQLVGNRFAAYLSPADRSPFSALLKDLFSTGARFSRELTLAVKDRPATTVKFDAVLSEDRQECRAMAQDVSEHIRSEARLSHLGHELAAELHTTKLMNQAMVNRELRMIELKNEVDGLLISAGKPARYHP